MDLQKLEPILKRIDSCHLAHLWSFYRPVFESDQRCIEFFSLVFHSEPEDSAITYDEETDDIVCMTRERVPVQEEAFLPRRMVNCVERLVLAARDMEQIRPGKDIFKIIYIITCAESLQLLSGKDLLKAQAVQTFFEGATSTADKIFIGNHFFEIEQPLAGTNQNFQYFVGVLNELRNCAAHEGNLWDICFASKFDDSGQLIVLDIDLEKFTRANKENHGFITQITYSQFEEIFIRTCITFIENYVKDQYMGIV